MAALQANITAEGVVTSLQISKIGNIPSGGADFKPGRPFLIKVNAATVPATKTKIIPAGQQTVVETLLFPGWNPEICMAVLDNSDANLQFGY